MNSIAFNLLGLALQLLIAAQQPNVPTDIKIQAVQTATYAIEYAQGIMPDETPAETISTTNIAEKFAEVAATQTPIKEAPYGAQPTDFGTPVMQEVKQ